MIKIMVMMITIKLNIMEIVKMIDKRIMINNNMFTHLAKHILQTAGIFRIWVSFHSAMNMLACAK